jgi:hypothetical protein
VDLLLCYEIETHDLPVLFTAEALPLEVHNQIASHSANHNCSGILSSFLTFKIHIHIQNNMVFES